MKSFTRRSLLPAACVMATCVTAALVPAALVPAQPLTEAPHCSIFPANNPWNQRVNGVPVARDSAALIAAIGLHDPAHPDFGAGTWDGEPIGIPITIVSRHTKHVHAGFLYASESDRGLYPFPANAAIEGGPQSTGDRHVLMLDRDTCRDYELYDAHPLYRNARWHAGSGAIFDLRSDRLRPAGWTSADAAGLPILPGLARYDEVKAGVIDHALRFTAPCTAGRYVYPARHYAATCSGGGLPPMGLRVRLKASVNISHLPYQARVVARALQRYGMILADNGSPWYISGAPDNRWSNDALHALTGLRGSDFEVVDTSSLPRPGL